MNFRVVINKDEDGYYVASVPALPGCHSQGKSIEESINNIKEAITGYISVAKKHGDSIVLDNEEVIETTVKIPALSST